MKLNKAFEYLVHEIKKSTFIKTRKPNALRVSEWLGFMAQIIKTLEN